MLHSLSGRVSGPEYSGRSVPSDDQWGRVYQRADQPLASVYFVTYVVGQLINGFVGDRIKAKYMISFGLALAGVSNIVFVALAGTPDIAVAAYAMTGFCLAVIYAPMTKVVAENTLPIYATRCSMGCTCSSYFGSPMAGVLVSLLVWQSAFHTTSAALLTMGAVCFVCFTLLERKGVVVYGRYSRPKETAVSVKPLLERLILRFTVISMLTGVIRTTVVFWLPTYISQYLGFAPEKAALTFTLSTLVISSSAFVAIFLYERLGRNIHMTLFLPFTSSAICFGLAYVLKNPMLNIICLVFAILSSNVASPIMWSRYCPSLRDTGMVSSATGFLDFASYMAAASSTLFANAATQIGWGPLILVWMGLALLGVLISHPWNRKLKEYFERDSILSAAKK